MAREMLQMQQYREGKVEDSLVNVFHKMDDMLRDPKFHEEVRAPSVSDARCPGQPCAAGMPAPMQTMT